MERASCHLCGDWNLEVAFRFLENLTSGVAVSITSVWGIGHDLGIIVQHSLGLLLLFRCKGEVRVPNLLGSLERAGVLLLLQ
jgi:hypothetical protein